MKESRGGKWMEDSHAKVDNDIVIVGVLGAVEDVFGSVMWVKRQREMLEGWRAAITVGTNDGPLTGLSNR